METRSLHVFSACVWANRLMLAAKYARRKIPADLLQVAREIWDRRAATSVPAPF